MTFIAEILARIAYSETAKSWEKSGREVPIFDELKNDDGFVQSAEKQAEKVRDYLSHVHEYVK